jgi:hypothetical protein
LDPFEQARLLGLLQSPRRRRIRMERELTDAVNQKDDHVMIVDLGPDEEKAREAITVIGTSLPQADRGIVVI